MQGFLQDVDGFKADIDDGGRRFDFAVTQAADQVFDAVGDRTKTLQAHLRGGSLDGVNRAEQPIDLFGVVVAFERDQAIADNLKMFFGFWLEEFENFGADFVIERQARQSRSR